LEVVMGIFTKFFGGSAGQSVDSGLRGSAFGAGRENPVCSSCGTAYNRAEVIRLIKMQSPYIFDFARWTTKFVCVRCHAHIVISGVRGE